MKGDSFNAKINGQDGECFSTISNKDRSNKILKAISTAFNLIMPLIILGAIFTLLSTLSLDAYQQFLADSGSEQF
ncbi:MAG: hypothetical protein ACLS85_01220 [Coprobacillus cateniformis]